MITDKLAAIVVAVVVLVGYFIPTIIAAARRHRNAAPIILVNVLLGWTFLGWLVSFIWSLTYQPPRLDVINR